MDFYTLAYVESQATASQTWGFIIIDRIHDKEDALQ